MSQHPLCPECSTKLVFISETEIKMNANMFFLLYKCKKCSKMFSENNLTSYKEQNEQSTSFSD